MIYLASPYSHPQFDIVEQRVEQTRACFARLISDGLHVFSPILMTHEAAKTHRLPGDAAFWQSLNTDFIRRMDSVYVLCISGWATSLGVRQEITLARQIDLTVQYINVHGLLLREQDLPA